MNNCAFKTKKVEVTRTYNVYDGPKLPYLDESKATIYFVTDGELSSCLSANDYDNYIRAVDDDGYLISRAVQNALDNHTEGKKYVPIDCYEYNDYVTCKIGDFIFESNFKREFPTYDTIVKFKVQPKIKTK